ncbi:hypothetical protein MNBD_ALPHA08-1532 [hydrothermal vent metagenome]|uniref:RCK C-terminal domain-containing protein n=1 Tax=hydrothermal vent metagenome TaxID=652676 RepID=A0A3B0S1H0_9ZZZZ
MHMWMTFAIIAIAIAMFAGEWLALELVALGVIAALLLYFNFQPLLENGENLLSAEVLLSGFSNTALLTILALLVVGQGLHQSGALDGVTQFLSATRRSRAKMILLACLTGAGVMSAFLNNTPVVVMFIPVIAALANRYGPGAGRMLIPLSYITILGGMVTLIGSSTNLLVAGLVAEGNVMTIGFFDLFMPGIILAGVGALYVLFVAPRLLRHDEDDGPAQRHARDGVQFLARLEIHAQHKLIGEQSNGGLFPSLTDVAVRLVKRDHQIILPPFDDVTLQVGDIVQIAGSRKQVTQLIDLDDHGEHLMMAEAAIAPASRLGGRTIVDEEFTDQTGCHIIGLQRHRRMKRDLRNRIRLRPGDVFLIAGTRDNIRRLRLDRDLMVLAGSISTLHAFTKANAALAIFATVVVAAATGVVPIVISAVTGALAMILYGCLNIGQAARAIDRRIVLLVVASIAMAHALDKTGGATFLAQTMVGALSDQSPAVILSALFLVVAVLTNLLSNNATALLFTPIAINIALSLGVSPVPFVHAVIFAANCSFASPMGYQTNLLVMGPGNYRFNDFLRTGGPLVILIWLTFSAIAPWYYSL